jgi:hypothetical protein
MSSGWPGRMAVCFRGRMNWAGQAQAYGSVLSAHPSLWSAFHRLQLRNGCGGSPRRLVVAKANSGETLRHPCSLVPLLSCLDECLAGDARDGISAIGMGSSSGRRKSLRGKRKKVDEKRLRWPGVGSLDGGCNG